MSKNTRSPPPSTRCPGSPNAAVKNGVVTVVKPMPLPAKPASLTGMIDPSLLMAQQALPDILNMPYLAAMHTSGRPVANVANPVRLTSTGVIDPSLEQARAYDKSKPTGIILTDPGVAAAQQAQEMIKLAPYLHLK